MTINEVLIASLLLMTAVIPILKALTSAQIASTDIEHKTKSLMLARAKVEEVRARTIYAYSTSYSASSAVLSGSYLCNITDSAVNSNLREITVSAGYDEDGNRVLGNDEIQVNLKTLIAKRW